MRTVAAAAFCCLLTACDAPGDGSAPPVHATPDAGGEVGADVEQGGDAGDDAAGPDAVAVPEVLADGDGAALDANEPDATPDVGPEVTPDAGPDVTPDVCTPSCGESDCGPDGCGGVCGTCGSGAECSAGRCEAVCTPDCEGGVCGPNGCGGLCGTCEGGEACQDGQCAPVCEPSCGSKTCGPDGCGGVCGTCGESQECVGGQCEGVCAPACDGKACGGDGCGGSCGGCGDGDHCVSGQCEAVCTPDCSGKECGPDGCGGTCGTCGVGELCAAGQCEAICTPDCSGKECGGDGCGGSCGVCGSGDSCVSGQCEAICTPDCSGKECGGDGCGGSCGVCGSGDSCVSGQCECVPSCGGKSCGSDGCGGSCGTCGAGEQCVLGACKVPTGDTCSDAFLVDYVPYMHSHDTETTSSGQYSAPSGACPGASGSIGDDALDIVYTFVPPVTGPYELELYADFDSGLYVATSCGDLGGTCLGGVDEACSGCTETLSLDLTAGEPVRVFVDGSWHFHDGGAYILSIDKGCDPTCTGWECGDDGCGGSCGTCPTGEVCLSGQCEVPEPNEACEPDHLIDALPYSKSRYLYHGTSQYAVSSCQGDLVSAGHGAEHMYELTAPVYGEYVFDLDTPVGTSLVLGLYVVRDCTKTSQTCMGYRMQGAVRAILQPGETVYAIVDAEQSSDSGDYTLGVDVCVPECGGLECGLDSKCGVSCGQCPGGETCGATGQCEAGLPGDACAAAFEVSSVPSTGTSSLDGLADDFEFKECPYFSSFVRGAGVPDQVWTFTAPEAGKYEALLEDVNGGGMIFYMASDCADVYGTCQDWEDACKVWSTQCANQITFDLDAGETRYFVVDGYDAEDVGPYRLTFDLACPESCVDQECGPDPCLGNCGTCPSGFACDDAGQCQPSADLLIHEIDYDTPGADSAEFVEIHNAGSEPADLAAYTFESVNGNGGGVLEAVPLADAGATLPAGGYLVIGQAEAVAAVPSGVPTITVSSSFLQNGGLDGDAVRLVHTTDGTVEAVSWDAAVPGANEGGTHAGSSTSETSLSRCPNGVDTDDNAADFTAGTVPTPGAANACP